MDLDQLRGAWHRAVEKDKPADAVKALEQLEKLEPREPRWSQRLGEAYRRVGQPKSAVDAFARAFERYFALGFVPSAIAMAKVVSGLDAERGAALEGSVPRPPPAVMPKVVAPVPLRPAEDSTIDEVRFVDAPDASIEILLSDLGIAPDGSEIVVFDSSKDVADTDPEDAFTAMASFRLFASLSDDAVLAMANVAELVEFTPGTMIAVKDEKAAALYAIVSGRAKVTVAGSPDIFLGDGDILGESSLLDEGVRQASVRAESPVMALRIDKEHLDAVVKDHPEVENVLFDLLARRLVSNLVHVSKLFNVFEPVVRLELAQMFEVRRAEAGTLLSKQGAKSDALYVILAGDVVLASERGPGRRIARGTAFGHSALIGNGIAEATVTAQTEAILLRMPASGFAALAAQYPPALAHLAETAGEPLPMSRRPP